MKTVTLCYPIVGFSFFLAVTALGCSSEREIFYLSDTDAPNERDGATDARNRSDVFGADGSDVSDALDSGTHPDAQDTTSDTNERSDTLHEDVQETGPPPPCKTRITYGSSWIHGSGHPEQFDITDGTVRWDGACHTDGNNSYAVLSNGWKPYFTGPSGCVIAFDYENCPDAPKSCQTRITYGTNWKHGPNHPEQFDEVTGPISTSGICRNDGSSCHTTLSNGWKPVFSGNNACHLSMRYYQCGSLYTNPVFGEDCPDPGVIHDGTRYVMTCTGGGGGNAYPIRTSTNLVDWKWHGHIFTPDTIPSWTKSHYWAPEIHKVGSKFIAYFTAMHKDNVLCVGAATSDSALGPFKDIGKPLLRKAGMGLIDASYYQSPSGTRYILWKEDGNAIGKPTPIFAQELADDGITLKGSAVQLITNDQAWEGILVEGPYLLDHDGKFYLFYSANGYSTPDYAVGVARANSVLGPYTKHTQRVLRGGGAWDGPGHGTIVKTPANEYWHVYHSWKAGQIGKPPGRIVLLDRIVWIDGWPTMHAAPSNVSQPRPR